MASSIRLSRRLRWAVPAGAVTVTAGMLAGSLITAAQATPSLPSRTPAQLLAEVVGRAGPLPPLTGTVVETAALGLPDLPAMGDPTSPQSLVTGSHTIRVWYADPQHIRLAIPGQLSETDLIRNGQDAWQWSSVQNTVTHYRLPADGHPVAPVPSLPPSALTPQQAADEALAAVGPTTAVSVASNVTVAGEASYELVLAPRDSRSLVGQIRIAIDAAHDVPLRVQIIARGEKAPAFQTGFTAITFTRPAAANFDFTPPAGATVVQGELPARHSASAGMAVIPAPGTAVGPARTGAVRVIPGPGTVRRLRVTRVVARGVPFAGVAGALPGLPGVVAAPAGAAQSIVVGHGWLAVAVLSGNVAVPGVPGRPGPALPGGRSVAGFPLGALLGAASHVQGSWGSGMVLRTKLISVLLTSDGRLLIGAVTPDVLYQAAAKTSGLASRAGR